MLSNFEIIKGAFKKMKKNVSILLIVLCTLVIFTSILFAKETKYDFRKTNWGMSKEQVKATEDKSPDFEDNIILNYSIVINGKDFVCTYMFLNDKLYKSKSVFAGQHINKNLYIDDYKELKEIFIKKYGKPKFDDYPEKWGDDIYKDNKNDLVIAISVGDEAYWAQWETPTTKIDLYLWGKNNKINLNISYKSDKILKSEFLVVVKELDTPQKICAYMRNNFEYELHTIYTPAPHILWENKKGDCNDFSTFGVYIANHHGYKTYQIFINFKKTTLGHTIAVYKENGKYNYSSNWEYFPIQANNFKEVVEHYFSFDDEYELKNYKVYDYEMNLIEEGK